MKSFLLSIATLFFAQGLYADTGMRSQHGDNCFREAFMATHPNNFQKAQARRNFARAHHFFESRREMVERRAHHLQRLLSDHPINTEASFHHWHELNAQITQIKGRFFLASMQTVNVLDYGQRTFFNLAMEECHRDGGGSDDDQDHGMPSLEALPEAVLKMISLEPSFSKKAL